MYIPNKLLAGMLQNDNEYLRKHYQLYPILIALIALILSSCAPRVGASTEDITKEFTNTPTTEVTKITEEASKTPTKTATSEPTQTTTPTETAIPTPELPGPATGFSLEHCLTNERLSGAMDYNHYSCILSLSPGSDELQNSEESLMSLDRIHQVNELLSVESLENAEVGSIFIGSVIEVFPMFGENQDEPLYVPFTMISKVSTNEYKLFFWNVNFEPLNLNNYTSSYDTAQEVRELFNRRYETLIKRIPKYLDGGGVSRFSYILLPNDKLLNNQLKVGYTTYENWIEFWGGEDQYLEFLNTGKFSQDMITVNITHSKTGEIVKVPVFIATLLNLEDERSMLLMKDLIDNKK